MLNKHDTKNVVLIINKGVNHGSSFGCSWVRKQSADPR